MHDADPDEAAVVLRQVARRYAGSGFDDLLPLADRTGQDMIVEATGPSGACYRVEVDVLDISGDHDDQDRLEIELTAWPVAAPKERRASRPLWLERGERWDGTVEIAPVAPRGGFGGTGCLLAALALLATLVFLTLGR